MCEKRDGQEKWKKLRKNRVKNEEKSIFRVGVQNLEISGLNPQILEPCHSYYFLQHRHMASTFDVDFIDKILPNIAEKLPFSDKKLDTIHYTLAALDSHSYFPDKKFDQAIETCLKK